jgi:hypothetical protein
MVVRFSAHRSCPVRLSTACVTPGLHLLRVRYVVPSRKAVKEGVARGDESVGRHSVLALPVHPSILLQLRHKDEWTALGTEKPRPWP